MSEDTEYKYTTLKYIVITIGCLSIISCLITIITFLLFKKIRTFILELVMYLSISSLLQTISFIIFFPKDDSESRNKLCQFQAFGMEFFGLSQFLWTCLISFSIYRSVIYLRNYNSKETNLRLIRFCYIFIGYGIPFIVACFGLIFKIYGVAGFWCFIDTDKIDKSKDNKYEIFYIITFALLWICIFFNVILYTMVIKYLKKSFDEIEESRIRNYTKPLMMYSIIQILCIFPTTIVRIYQLFNFEYFKELDYIQSICDVSQGFLYSLAYGFNPIVKRTILNVFRKETFREIDEIRESNINRKIGASEIRSDFDYTNMTYLD